MVKSSSSFLALLFRLFDSMVVRVLASSRMAASTGIRLFAAFASTSLIIFSAAFCALPLGSGLLNITEWSRSIVQEVIGSPLLSVPKFWTSSLNPKFLPSSPALLFSSSHDRFAPPITSIFASRAAFKLEWPHRGLETYFYLCGGWLKPGRQSFPVIAWGAWWWLPYLVKSFYLPLGLLGLRYQS